MGYGTIQNLCFNQDSTFSGAKEGILGIQEGLVEFITRQETLPYISCPLNEQDGAGLYSDYLKRNLITNKILLQRLGVRFN